MRRATEGVWLTHAFGRAAAATPAGPLIVRAVRGELVFERVDVKPSP
jgi:hypothetical protein